MTAMTIGIGILFLTPFLIPHSNQVSVQSNSEILLENNYANTTAITADTGTSRDMLYFIKLVSMMCMILSFVNSLDHWRMIKIAREEARNPFEDFSFVQPQLR